MSDDTPVVDVFNARNHLFDILQSRGYEVSDYVGYDMSHVSAMMEHSQLKYPPEKTILEYPSRRLTPYLRESYLWERHKFMGC